MSNDPNRTMVDFTELVKEKFTMRKDIAPVETSTTASQAYTTGEQFYFNDILREATTDIAQGDTLTLNTNYKNADPVTTSIQNLSNQVKSDYEKLGYNLLNMDRPSKITTNVDWIVNPDLSVTAKIKSSPSAQQLFDIIYKISTDTSFGGRSLTFPFPVKILGSPVTGTDSNDIRIAIQYADNSWQNAKLEGFTVPANTEIIRLALAIPASASAQTIEFKPMIVNADRFPNAAYTDYQPYGESNPVLTQETTGLIDNTKANGGVNSLENFASTAVVSPVTFTVNADKTVTATATTATSSVCNCNITWTSKNYKLKAGTYKLTGCPDGGKVPTGTNDTFAIECYNQTAGSRIGWEIGNGLVFTLTAESVINVSISIRSGYNLNGSKVFKPMISLASMNLSYNDYVPYAKSNRELTEDVNAINEHKPTNVGSVILSSGDASYWEFTTNEIWVDTVTKRVIVNLIVKFKANQSARTESIRIGSIPSNVPKPSTTTRTLVMTDNNIICTAAKNTTNEVLAFRNPQTLPVDTLVYYYIEWSY